MRGRLTLTRRQSASVILRPAFVNPHSEIRNPKSVEVVCERVGERAELDAARGVYELARGLYDDDYVLVLVDDFERRALGRHGVRDFRRGGDLDRVARAQTRARARPCAVDRARAAREQPRDVHAAQGGDSLGEEVVEPLTRGLFADVKLSLQFFRLQLRNSCETIMPR